MCGGIFLRVIFCILQRGLSPRVWGHRNVPITDPPVYGSIPTCVGASRRCPGSARSPRVYPHVCGGIALADDATLDRRGLSPRVWGHLQVRPRHQDASGSIPTCVGASTVPLSRSSVATVYPHVCGGIDRVSKNTLKIEGLSPRVWGHLARVLSRLRRYRSIPTCVGASRSGRTWQQATGVYPHVCGGICFRHKPER